MSQRSRGLIMKLERNTLGSGMIVPTKLRFPP